MKGVVFSEFIEMVEDKFSPEIADRIIDQADLPSGGAYTTVGTYDHAEILSLVGCLSNETSITPGDLVQAFGSYLFSRFHTAHPSFFTGMNSAFDFLGKVEDYIHVEVRKLYPDAELPSLECEAPDTNQLRMTYRSKRPFAALAEGLIRGCVAHFEEDIDIAVEDLSDGAGTAARFVLIRN